MAKIIFGFIMLDRLHNFIHNKKYNTLVTNYNLLLERLYIEENGLLDKYGFSTFDELYSSSTFLNPGVVKLKDIVSMYGTNGFLVVGLIKNTNEIVYTGLITHIQLSEYMIGNINNDYGFLLSNLGISYNYRGKGYCTKIIKKIINKCISIYKSGTIYSEILPSNTKSQHCHMKSGFKQNVLLTNQHSDNIFEYVF